MTKFKRFQVARVNKFISGALALVLGHLPFSSFAFAATNVSKSSKTASNIKLNSRKTENKLNSPTETKPKKMVSPFTRIYPHQSNSNSSLNRFKSGFESFTNIVKKHPKKTVGISVLSAIIICRLVSRDKKSSGQFFPQCQTTQSLAHNPSHRSANFECTKESIENALSNFTALTSDFDKDGKKL